jgi:hypothetical protein
MARNFRGLCFAGREHHVKKLKSMIQYLEQRDFEFTYITGNNVLNIDNYESPLLREESNYVHLFDFLDSDTVEEINKVSGIMQKDLEPENSLSEGFSEYVSSFYVRFSIRDLAETHILFRKALEELNPDVVFILHECNFWTKSLAYCANRAKIPVVSFQEGQYASSRVSPEYSPFRLMTEFSTKVFLWGPKEFDFLNTSEAAREKLDVVGAPHLDEFITISEEAREHIRGDLIKRHDLGSVSKIVVFAIPHTKAASGDILKIIADLIGFFASKPNFALVLRFHPFEAFLAKSLSPLWGNLRNVCCDQDTETPDLITAIDLCLCQRTSFGLECLALGKPIVEINYCHSSADLAGYFNQGIASLIASPDDIARISDFLSSEKAVSDSSKALQILEENFFSIDGKTRERVYERLLGIVTA